MLCQPQGVAGQEQIIKFVSYTAKPWAPRTVMLCEESCDFSSVDTHTLPPPPPSRSSFSSPSGRVLSWFLRTLRSRREGRLHSSAGRACNSLPLTSCNEERSKARATRPGASETDPGLRPPPSVPASPQPPQRPLVPGSTAPLLALLPVLTSWRRLPKALMSGGRAPSLLLLTMSTLRGSWQM